MFKTVKAAKEALAGKLVFGDEKQIAAVRFIDNVEAAGNAILSCDIRHDFKASVKCWNCSGTGQHECECGDEHSCGHCEGSGKIDRDKGDYSLECKCVERFSGVVISEAVREIMETKLAKAA